MAGWFRVSRDYRVSLHGCKDGCRAVNWDTCSFGAKSANTQRHGKYERLEEPASWQPWACNDDATWRRTRLRRNGQRRAALALCAE
jgi:hypothetical protein